MIQPEIVRRKRARAASSAAIFLGFAALAAAAGGCAQEGKTVITQLSTPGLAVQPLNVLESVRADTFDVFVDPVANHSFAFPPGDSIRTTTVRDIDLGFDTVTLFQNGCEARGGLEIKREGLPNDPLFVITPTARYTVDEPCNVGIAGDTVQVLLVRNVPVSRVEGYRPDPGQPESTKVRFEVRGAGEPPIPIQILVENGATLDSTTWRVQVQDKTTGDPLAGALVRIESSGGPELYGEGSTDANGFYVLERTCTGTVGSEDVRYTVKVSYSGRTTNLRLGSRPARCRRLESVVVRV